MISHLRRPGSPVVTDYIEEVAAAADAQSIQWWDGDHGVDAVLVLPCHIEHFRPQWAVLAWNHRFGWAVGAQGRTHGTVVLLEGLGVGPAPTPDRCAAAATTTILALYDWTPPPPAVTAPWQQPCTALGNTPPFYRLDPAPRKVHGHFTPGPPSQPSR
ncbi:DUF6292 family protein [Rhodococcus koreensis]|uniref:DUF6292 family protein n=1 Tax=Rhodococcus koreensis TaxID=99653 RepID=UPI0036DF6BED